MGMRKGQLRLAGSAMGSGLCGPVGRISYNTCIHYTIYRISETFIFYFYRVTFSDSNILINRNITMAPSILRFHSEHGEIGANPGPNSYSGGVRQRNIFIPTTHV